MFRKRKTVSPFYRMPAPYNPISGADHPLDPPKKPYCRFVLTEALDTATESAKAVILTAHQWGPGDYHCPDVIIHVHNLLVEDTEEDDPVYQFSLAVGGVGMALWDYDNHWRMIGAGGLGGNRVSSTVTIIPARVDLKPGGPIECPTYKLGQNEGTGEYELQTTGTLVDVFSWIKSDSSDPAAEEDGILWIFIEQDAEGVWWFTGQDCPAGGY